jgi:hypothetical protein
MRPAVFVSVVLAGGALVAPATAGAARSAGSREVRPFFDSREGAAAAATPRSAGGNATGAAQSMSSLSRVRPRLGRATNGLPEGASLTEAPGSGSHVFGWLDGDTRKGMAHNQAKKILDALLERIDVVVAQRCGATWAAPAC